MNKKILKIIIIIFILTISINVKAEDNISGTFNITSKLNNNKVIDLSGGTIRDSRNIQIYQSNGTNAQNWRITKESDGYYTISIASNNNYVLDVSGGIFANSSNVQLYRRNNTIAQKWIIEKSENNYYTIYSYNRNYVLDVSGGLTSNGTNIQIFQSNGTNAQKFYLTETTTSSSSSGVSERETAPNYVDINNDTYMLSSVLNNQKALDLSGGTIKNSSNIWLYTANYTEAQKWKFTKGNDGYYTIALSSNNNYVLDVSGGIFNNYSNVQLYYRNNTPAQKWKLIKDANGYFSIVSYNNKFVLDVNNASTIDGTNIQIFQSNGTNAQKFLINRVVTGIKTIDSGLYYIDTIDSNNSIYLASNNIDASTKNNSSNERWYIKYLNNGYYTIRSYADGYALTIANNNKKAGGNVTYTSYNESISQQWAILKNNDGTYTITSRYNGYNIDISNNNVIVKDESDATTQKYKINKALDYGTKTIEDGYYFINSKLDNKRSIDISGGTIKENQNVQLYTSNSTYAQKWFVKYLENGYYNIKANKDEDYCLTNKNNNIQINKCDNSSDQQWIIKESGNGYYSIVNENYSFVSVKNSSTSDGTNIDIENPTYSNAQVFKFIRTADGETKKLSSNGYYTISSSLDENYVVDLSSANTSNGNNIHIYTQNGTKAQKWNFIHNSNGYYTIATGLDNNKKMDAASNNNVQINSSNSNYSEQWVLKEAGNDYYYIISNSTGLYLEVNNSNAENYTNLQVGEFTGADNQKFKITKTRLENIVIDVSAHNGNIDWATVKRDSGIYGAIVRISGGAQNEDTKLATNISALKQYNIPYGIYIYSYAENYNEGVYYGDWTNSIINKYNLNPTLGIYLDLENSDSYNENILNSPIGTAIYTDITKGYVSKVPNARIYANLNYANGILNTPYLRSKLTWIAQWESKCDYTDYYNLWQYTSKGSVPGINGNVDMSYYYID